MRTLARALTCGLLATALAFTACDDDDDNGGTDTSPADTADTTGGETTPETVEETTAPDTTPPEDTAQPDTTPPEDTAQPETTEDTTQPETTPTGACTNEADLAIIQANDPSGTAGQCGLACLGDADPRACSADCITNGKGNITGTGLSDGCSGCYADTIKCAIDNCIPQCLDTASQACADCRENAGCNAAFYACSGLPED